MTKDEMDKVTAALPTKSAKIRALHELGAKRAEIANYLHIRYQHVRNVLVSPPPSDQNSNNRQNSPTPTTIHDSPAAVSPLSIDEAKRGLAARFGVLPSAIDITIRG